MKCVAQRLKQLLNVEYIVPLATGSLLLILANPFHISFFPAALSIWIVYIARQMKLSLYANMLLNLLAHYVTASLAFELVLKASKYSENITSTQKLQYLFVIIIFFFFFWTAILSLINKLSNKWSHFLVFLTVIILIFLSYKNNLPLPIKLFLQTLTFLNIQNMCFFMLEIINGRNSKKAINLATAVTPFWNPGPIPFEHNTEINADEKQIKIMYSGVYILLYILFVQYILLDKQAMLANINPSIKLALESKPQIILAEPYQFTYFYSDLSLSLWERWTITVGGFVHRLLLMSIGTGYVVATARLCGLPVLQYVQNPFSAKNFYELLTKTNYHYVHLINKLLMGPLVTTLTIFKSMHLRIAAVTFISIFMFGYVFHFFIFPYIFLKISPETYFIRYMGYYLYFLLLAAWCSFSVYFSLKNDRQNIVRPIPRAIKNIIYLLIYAIIFSLIGSDYFRYTPEAHLSFTLSLFGISL